MDADFPTDAEKKEWARLGAQFAESIKKKQAAKAQLPPAKGPNAAPNGNLELALRYAAAGLRVFPVNGRKEPWVKHWKEDATINPQQIRDLWSRRFNAGVGLPMGANGLIAIDADRHGLKDGVAELNKLIAAHGLWPEHPIVDTRGGGEHHIFLNPDALGNHEGGFKGLGINIRGDRGYIVAPGTATRDGRWVPREGCPDLIDAIQSGTVPEVPEWVVGLIKQPNRVEPEKAPILQTPVAREEIDAIVAKAPNLVASSTEGSRNENLNRAGGLAADDGDRSVSATIDSGLTADDLTDALADKVTDLALELLGGPNLQLSTKDTWRYGKKGSLKLEVSGLKRGCWYDFEAGNGGGPLQLICREKGFSDAEAWARQWLGWPESAPTVKVNVEALRLNAKRKLKPDPAPKAPTVKVNVEALLLNAERKLKPDRAPKAPTIKVDVAALRLNAERKLNAEVDAKRQHAIRLWNEATPLEIGSIGDQYLSITRGIPRPDGGWPAAIRWHLGIQAIVCAATADDGQVVAVQRIYLTTAAEKIGGDKAKMSLGSVSEGVVRLSGRADGPLLLAEGIETGLSVWRATGYETWVMFGSIAKAKPPLDRVIIVCRDDDKHNAQSFNAIRKAYRGWIAAGLDVRIATPWAEQRGDKSDFNDVIRIGRCAAVAERINMVLDRPDPTVRITLDDAGSQVEKAVSLFFSTAQRESVTFGNCE
jgi:Bifunctional DNA primase/polymerase, N-terminal/Toprim domain